MRVLHVYEMYKNIVAKSHTPIPRYNFKMFKDKGLSRNTGYEESVEKKKPQNSIRRVVSNRFSSIPFAVLVQIVSRLGHDSSPAGNASF